MKTWKDYLNIITLEEIRLHYDIENRTLPEICEYFNITQGMFIKILKYYNFHKSKESHVKNIKKTKKERYGNENYNNSNQTKVTNLKKYGVDNQFKRKDLAVEIAEKKISLYGDKNNNRKNLETRIKNNGSLRDSYQKQQIIRKATCLEKYGYETAAESPEIKNKITESVKKTFLNTYGVENYWQLPNAKRSCGSKNSSHNLHFAELLASENIVFEAEKQVGGKYFDFCVGKTLIEINPSATHNATWSPFNDHGIDKLYHQQKSLIAKENNFDCIHIWDWDDLNKIIMRLKDDGKIIGARKCAVIKVEKDIEKNFLEKNHIQGYVKSQICLGLIYDDKLVSVMSFGKPRYNNRYDYELLRYASIAKVIGGAKKLFKHFINNYQVNSIISYCDLSKFSGELYLQLGFKLKNKPNPSKHWYNIETKIHITDNLLRQRGFDQLFKTDFGKGTSNELLMLKHGFVEIYDVGQATYIYERNK